jgi:hypothetical protein
VIVVAALAALWLLAFLAATGWVAWEVRRQRR